MRCVLFTAGLIFAFAAGCGGYNPNPGVIVTGKLVQGGNPLVVPSAESGGNITIQLCPRTAQPDGSPGDAANGEYKADGSVRFLYAGTGIPPGKYLLTVELSDGTSDRLAGKFGMDQSPFVINVPKNKVGGTYDFGTIDLDAPPAAIP